MIGTANNLTALNNLKLFGAVLFIAFLFIGPTSVAQERHDNPQEESFQSPEEESDSLESIDLNKDVFRDSVEVKPVLHSRSKQEGTPHKNKPEDETLSFNFLYFIIQKFKVSDLIED